MTSGAAWYAGTAQGLFLVERTTDGAAARPLSLDGQGGFRAAVLVDCDDSSRLYAGTTRGGMFRSDDGGETWHEINHGILYKDIWSLVQHPRTGTLYVGTSPAGIFRSDDRGDTWVACDALWQLPTTSQWHGPVPPHFSRMKGLALNDGDPNLIFGAIEEGWLVRSDDGGRTWAQISEGVPHDSHTLQFVPGEQDALVLGGNDGWRRSTDGGRTWSAANVGLGGRSYTAAPLLARPEVGPTLIGCVTAVNPGHWSRPEGGDAAFCRSVDGGRSWTTFADGLPRPMVAIPRALAVDPSTAQGFLAGATDGTVWRTADGNTFHLLLDGLPNVMSLTPARS